MGERKVLNKYFPPDFDPKLVPKTKWDPFKQIETRMMLPFNIQCETCGEFMYRGKKFNMRKEDVFGDDYKGIRKYRFYMKCIMCSREITFITDPENMEYAMEQGAKRLFEVWKEQDKMEKEAITKREEEEKADAMKALEHRTIDSKLEMDIMDALEETKAMSAKRDAIRPDHILAMRSQEDQDTIAGMEAEEENLIKSAFKKKGGANGGLLKKLDDSDEESESMASAPSTNGTAALLSSSIAQAAAKDKETAPGLGVLKPVIKIKAKKRKDVPTSNGATTTAKVAKQATAPAPAPAPAANGGGGLLGLASYGSSDEDSS